METVSQPQPPPLPPPPKESMPRWKKRILWGLGGFVILLLLCWVILDFVANSRLQETLGTLRDKGYATSLEEMAPPSGPKDENAAPLYLGE